MDKTINVLDLMKSLLCFSSLVLWSSLKFLSAPYVFCNPLAVLPHLLLSADLLLLLSVLLLLLWAAAAEGE